MCMLSFNKKFNVYSFEYSFKFLNSQLVGVSDTRLKVGEHVGLLTAGGGGCGVSWTQLSQGGLAPSHSW